MKLRQGFVLRELGNGFMACPEGLETMNFNKMFSLNESAAFMWRRMEGGEFTRKDLVDALLEEYDVTEERASLDVDNLLQLLIESGVVNE